VDCANRGPPGEVQVLHAQTAAERAMADGAGKPLEDRIAPPSAIAP
jgi:hypothetical protein